MTAAAVAASLDLRSSEAVERALLEGARANLGASCRHGSIDLIPRRGSLLATGDLHDNPTHFSRVLSLARVEEHSASAPRHVTLHELIHGDRLLNGMDFSHRTLAKAAALKAAFPESVHTLLANHELSQIVGAGVSKDGVNLVSAFDEAIEYAFGAGADAVREAVAVFIRSMPLALVAGDAITDGAVQEPTRLLFAHSLPPPELMDRFDAAVLSRGLTESDYTPRRGSAHIMVWGRGHTAEHVASLSSRWGVGLFVLGHEKAPDGWLAPAPNAVVLNSDHERGVALPIELERPPEGPVRASWGFVRLGESVE